MVGRPARTGRAHHRRDDRLHASRRRWAASLAEDDADLDVVLDGRRPATTGFRFIDRHVRPFGGANPGIVPRSLKSAARCGSWAREDLRRRGDHALLGDDRLDARRPSPASRSSGARPTTMEVWIDGDGIVRQVSYVVDADKAAASSGLGRRSRARLHITFDLSAVGRPVDIQPPRRSGALGRLELAAASAPAAWAAVGLGGRAAQASGAGRSFGPRWPTSTLSRKRSASTTTRVTRPTATRPRSSLTDTVKVRRRPSTFSTRGLGRARVWPDGGGGEVVELDLACRPWSRSAPSSAVDGRDRGLLAQGDDPRGGQHGHRRRSAWRRRCRRRRRRARRVALRPGFTGTGGTISSSAARAANAPPRPRPRPDAAVDHPGEAPT